MKSLLRNKKGATLDNFYVAISFFGFAIAMFIFLLIWSTLTSTQLNEELWTQTTEGTNARDNVQNFVNDMDFWVVGIWVFLHLGIIITAFFLRSHPIIYLAGIFLLLILVLVASPLQDVWNELYVDDDFSTVTSQMEVTNQLMGHFVISETVMGFLTLIILAGLAKSEGIF